MSFSISKDKSEMTNKQQVAIDRLKRNSHFSDVVEFPPLNKIYSPNARKEITRSVGNWYRPGSIFVSIKYKNKTYGVIISKSGIGEAIQKRKDGKSWSLPYEQRRMNRSLNDPTTPTWGFKKEIKNILNTAISKDISEIKNITKEIKSKSKKLPKKTLKLEGTQMKYKRLEELLRKAINYKRKRKMVEAIYSHISEEEKVVVPRRHNTVTIGDKRKKLKDIYRRMLNGTPYQENIPVFMELINQVDDNYIEYELQVNFNDAFKVVDELIRGKGDLTQEEMGELANIVSGVGIPAIEKHATGKHKMSKKDAKFGAEGLSKSAERFNKSVEARRNPKYKLEAPKSTAVVPVEISKEIEPARKALQKMFISIDIPKDSVFWKTAGKLKSKGINVERLAKSMTSATKYSKAKKKAEMELKKQGKSIEDLRGTDDIFNIWNQIKKKKQQREKVGVKR